jgi:hypothetical protein
VAACIAVEAHVSRIRAARCGFDRASVGRVLIRRCQSLSCSSVVQRSTGGQRVHVQRTHPSAAEKEKKLPNKLLGVVRTWHSCLLISTADGALGTKENAPSILTIVNISNLHQRFKCCAAGL